MAKTRSTPKTAAKKARTAGKPADTAALHLADVAEELGRLIGSAQAKAAGWLEQRKTIGDQLQKLRDSADGLLRDLGRSETVRKVRRAAEALSEATAAAPAAPRKRRRAAAKAGGKTSAAPKRRAPRTRKSPQKA